MLTELEQLQTSDESVTVTELSLDFETRSTENDEIIHKEYTFAYADEWDKWMFHEYTEKRTPDTEKIEDRNWRQTRNIIWTETREIPEIDVPPEVSQKLAEVTGADSITIQVPTGSIREKKYDKYVHRVE